MHAYTYTQLLSAQTYTHLLYFLSNPLPNTHNTSPRSTRVCESPQATCTYRMHVTHVYYFQAKRMLPTCREGDIGILMVKGPLR